MVQRRRQRGSILLVVVGLVLVIAVTGVAMVALTGTDSASTGKMLRQETAQSCAEAGLQYGRRLLGQRYTTTNGWNDYLNGTRPGRFDPAHFPGDTIPANLSTLPLELQGDADLNGVLDPGTDLDGDGVPDFLVTIRDDDDETPMGAAPNWGKDNNLSVILGAECTNPRMRAIGSGQPESAVIESTVTYIPGQSNNGNAVNNGNTNGGPGGG